MKHFVIGMLLICSFRIDMVTQLNAAYGETQQYTAVMSNEKIVMELWASPLGSWTILKTNTQGVSCLVGAGTHWGITS